jgi:YD repeat-containing protein
MNMPTKTNENKRKPGYGFLSSEPSDRTPTLPRPSGVTIAHNLHTDVHYPDVTIINPDGSKIQRFYSSACTSVKLQTATGTSRDYKWHEELTASDTTNFSDWPSNYSYSNSEVWPFWYHKSASPPLDSQEKYYTYSMVIPFRSLYEDYLDEEYRYFHPYTTANEAYLGELADFDDCNSKSLSAGFTVNIPALNNSWKRGYIVKECYKDNNDVIIKEVHRFYTMKPIEEDAYDVHIEKWENGNNYTDLRRAFCIAGWARLDTLKEIHYDPYGQNPTSHLTHYIYNSTNGLAEQIREKGYQNIRVTAIDYAFNHYNSTGSSVDMLDKNMLSAKAQETIYIYPMLYSVPTSLNTFHTTRARKSIVTTWKENWNSYNGQWAPERSYQWTCNGSSYDLPAFNAWSTTQTPTSSEWVLTSKALTRDTFTRPTGIINGRSDTTLYYYGTNSDPYADQNSGHYLTATQTVIGSAEDPPVSLGSRPGDDLFAEYEYNDLGQLTKITDENLKLRTFEYDSFWRFYREKNHGADIVYTFQYHYKADGADGVFDADDPNAILTKSYFNSTNIGESVTYFDGFGRAIQTQIDEGTSMIVQQTVYDSLGRKAVETLPARVLTLSSYNYKTDFIESGWEIGESMSSSSYVANYYDNNPIESNAPDANGYPYSLTKYCADPLNRIYQTGKPGSSFRIGSTNETDYYYHTHSSTISVGGLSYPAGTLLQSKISDENGLEIVEYVDELGNIVQKITDPGSSPHLDLLTSFHYDIVGNNTRIIPPKANNSETSAYCTNMSYDTRGNLVEKNTPDAGPVRYKYDANNNLRFEQDSLHCAGGRDLVFHIYDELNRLLITGQASRDASIPLWDNLDGNTDYRNDGTWNFENSSTEGTTYQLVNIYGAEPSYGSGVWSDATDPGNLYNLKGKLAASAYYDKNEEAWGYTFYSYNNDGLVQKMIQALSSEDVGIKTISYEYDRQGNITKTSYQSSQNDAFFIWQEYDLAGRLEKIYTDTVNTKPTYALAEYSYWPTGQVKRKKLSDPATGNKVQGVDYVYHIRGWLSQINDQNIYTSGDDPGGDSDDRFGQVIGYEAQGHIGSTFGSTNQYNGNISWLIQSTHGYTTYMTGSTFAYDNVNRLTTSDFGYYNAGTDQWLQYSSYGYDEREIQYDDNGNLCDLKRYDESGTLTRNIYTYYANTNQLKNIDNSANQDYQYDGNGNLTKDNNRNITNVLYDYRNLPYQFNIGSSAKLRCGYDSQGNRIYKKVHFE